MTHGDSVGAQHGAKPACLDLALFAATTRGSAAAAQTIIDFKTAAEKGILAGHIKSIIHPALADHVRREAVRFRNELMRAA